MHAQPGPSRVHKASPDFPTAPTYFITVTFSSPNKDALTADG